MTRRDIAPYKTTEPYQSMYYTHGHTQLVGLLRLQTDSGGIFVDRVDQHTFYFYSHHNSEQFNKVCFFHKQDAAGRLIKPVSKSSKLCPRKTEPSLTDAYLYCWWSLVLRVLAMKRSASFSRFLEYSISISDFFLKKSWRSCSSWTLMSVCWSKHFCCSTSCARISGGTQVCKWIRMMPQPVGTCTQSQATRTFFDLH